MVAMAYTPLSGMTSPNSRSRLGATSVGSSSGNVGAVSDGSDVPQMMLSPSWAVPQMMLSPSWAVPQMMLALSDEPQIVLSQSAPPQSVPQMMLSPSKAVPQMMLS